MPTFPLLEMDDADLDEEQKVEKKKQRLLKASYDYREKVKHEKDAAQKADEASRKMDDEFRMNNFNGWVSQLRTNRQVYADFLSQSTLTFCRKSLTGLMHVNSTKKL